MGLFLGGLGCPRLRFRGEGFCGGVEFEVFGYCELCKLVEGIEDGGEFVVFPVVLRVVAFDVFDEYGDPAVEFCGGDEFGDGCGGWDLLEDVCFLAM